MTTARIPATIIRINFQLDFFISIFLQLNKTHKPVKTHGSVYKFIDFFFVTLYAVFHKNIWKGGLAWIKIYIIRI